MAEICCEVAAGSPDRKGECAGDAGGRAARRRRMEIRRLRVVAEEQAAKRRRLEGDEEEEEGARGPAPVTGPCCRRSPDGRGGGSKRFLQLRPPFYDLRVAIFFFPFASFLTSLLLRDCSGGARAVDG